MANKSVIKKLSPYGALLGAIKEIPEHPYTSAGTDVGAAVREVWERIATDVSGAIGEFLENLLAENNPAKSNSIIQDQKLVRNIGVHNSPKVIHLSDFHISVPPDLKKQLRWLVGINNISLLIFSLISYYLKFIRHPSLANSPLVVGVLLRYIEENFPDAWVVISGDLTDKGYEEEYQLARELLEPIIKRGKLIVVPGNHDDGLPLEFPTFNIGYFYKYFGDCSGYGENGFPFVKQLGEDEFLIGVNSVHDFPRPTGTGSIGERQLSDLDRILSSKELTNKVKILVLHHDPFNPLPFTELNDAERFLETIKGRVDVVLCGHKHKSYIKRGYWGIRYICLAPESNYPDESGFIHFRSFEVKGNNQIRLGHHRLNLDKAIAKISSIEKLHK